ncbi:uncharacterized protein LOC127580795 isoform X2 [Pristis pectinata]|uniref:uncharacterized protein LOC127580795 isoform X2 n=1 Tax=Pristis pectinata TaxID=685728 RepID=UPI00223E453C|nr:uncharacterized protein LOC127580795 isoform X2 [Pristis pectinata]
MWILILLICSPPVSGTLSIKSNVAGVVGRAITVDCHYAATYRSHTKYWCHGWSRSCEVLVETNGQHERRGRVSITDNPAQGIFTVTVEDLHSEDTGWYSCGITTYGYDPILNVHLQVSDEPVSVPVLGFLSPANVSCVGGSVLVSCESVQGSLPIQYTWYERTPSVDSKISNSSKLDLRCQSFKHLHHEYYCRASNSHGKKSSGIVDVIIINKANSIFSYLIQFNGTEKEYSARRKLYCAENPPGGRNNTSTSNPGTKSNEEVDFISSGKCGNVTKINNNETTVTTQTVNSDVTSNHTQNQYIASYGIWSMGRWLLFALLGIWSISVTWFTRETKFRKPSWAVELEELLAYSPSDLGSILTSSTVRVKFARSPCDHLSFFSFLPHSKVVQVHCGQRTM